MEAIKQEFSVAYQYSVFFTEHLFDTNNKLLHNVLKELTSTSSSKILFVIDEGAARHHPDLIGKIRGYFESHPGLPALCAEPLLIPGGEQCKNDETYTRQILEAVNQYGIDRHSFVAAIGGGAVLDLVGYAAAIAHRGVRHIRIPTTVLSQNDSGVGVKNGINYFGKKNFLGTFVPPVAVLNDFEFLRTLHIRDWRSGIAEAIKVALIKDEPFFRYIESNAASLAARDMSGMKEIIYHCAKLHLDHIRGGGDPFEKGSSRPLDFGHWSAHKLEQMSDYRLRHGEAVVIGMALDVTYSTLKGMLSQEDAARVLSLFLRLGFRFYDPLLMLNLDAENRSRSVLAGLHEFREHLGDS
ncbi:3-dehydroquinate synthase [Anseongella ginsenosidimutans]|uniref:3-dehydroquinate synthase n=1 Tax=Anseongella ginsenosidimutans TaxID=496056 RepID=UPI001CEF9D21|nr:3-dehydroquinate synthase [Anseongella ginsenosidimutans]